MLTIKGVQLVPKVKVLRRPSW